jgi:hypothetical protein
MCDDVIGCGPCNEVELFFKQRSTGNDVDAIHAGIPRLTAAPTRCGAVHRTQPRPLCRCRHEDGVNRGAPGLVRGPSARCERLACGVVPELERRPLVAIVAGFDVHRAQITFTTT